MMKRVFLINKLTVLVLGISVLYGCQDATQRAVEREKFGIELFEKGEYGKAKLELASALKGDGTLGKTYYYLALLNEKEANFKGMRENLLHAVKFNPKNVDARVKLGKIHLLFNDLDKALLEANEVLSFSTDNLDALTLKAAIFIKQKKQSEALVLVDDILQKKPDQAEAISLKTLIYMKNEQFDDALNFVSPVIESGVKDISLHLLKIQLDARKANIEEVIKDYERLSKLHPEKVEFKIALAKIYSQADRKQKAENLLREIIKSDPDGIKPKLVLLDFLNSTSKNRVIEQVEKYTNEGLDKPESLFQISQWLLKMRYFLDAESLLSKISTLEIDAELQQQVKLQLAQIAFGKNDLKKSKEIVEEILSINSENLQANILKTKLYLAQEQYDKAEAILKTILWTDPNSDAALTLMAQIEIIKGNLDKADNKFREALEVNPANREALVAVVGRALKNKDTSYATELLENAIKIQPNSLDLLKQATEINIIAGDWPGVDKKIVAIEKHPEGRLLAKFLASRSKQEQGKFPEAIAGFKEILQFSPDYPDALRQMATCYEMLSQRKEMINYMTSFMEANPRHITAHLIMGQLFLLNKNYTQAISIYEKALEIDKKLPQIHVALARAYNELKEYKKAISLYKKGLEENPNNIRLSIYLASSYEKNHQYQKAIALYESLLAIDPGLEIATNNYIALLVDVFGDEKNIEKARKLAVKFKNSENPFYLDSYAWIELKSGNVDVALPLLEKVNTMANQVAVFKYHLGVAYYEQGNNAKALSYLRQAIDLGKKNGGFDENKLAEQLLEKLSIKKK
ncbi:MAG: tetratricopeptide repeat protein [Methylococcaceae bacterium]|nr:tetratricopeptide repeat protein [Methylococcaceae bacterium]